MPRKKQPVKKKTGKTKKKNSGGRPTVWTKENRESIYKFLRTGANYTRSCLMTGISRAVFNAWKKQGVEDRKAEKKTEYTDFLDKIEQAKAYYITFLHGSVNNQAKIDGEFALKILRIKAKDEFPKENKIEIESHNVNENTNTNINVKPSDSDEDLEKTIDILRTVRGLEKTGTDSEVSDPETE